MGKAIPRHQYSANTSDSYLDRIVAAFGGAAGLMAFSAYVSGDTFMGTVGVALVILSTVLCLPSRKRQTVVHGMVGYSSECPLCTVYNVPMVHPWYPNPVLGDQYHGQYNS